MNRNHLKEQNMTYFQHMRGALKEVWYAGLAVDLLFVHAFFPCFFDKYFSEYIKRVNKRMNNENTKRKGKRPPFPTMGA
jgi:hypothetical protein